ncbi:MAG: N-acetylmuramoyl-L-alanine amidase [Hungatella sp.]|nr:N-acetylmuramoyl-L-alanine amidase [Hungatella sp.]
MAILLLFLIYHMARQAAILTAPAASSSASTSPVVVIDSGHGGIDPGKVGIDGSLEKDINLQIARRLKTYLEASDVTVVMTRDSDCGMYKDGDKNKKSADMKNRCSLINNAAPDLTVSIHQNSYHEESIKGGQVFYYKNSDEGRELAEILQKRFDFVLGDGNTRAAKANSNYYLLLHVRSPIVIVECGFLSNSGEAAKLGSPDYQDRLAWTIHMGIMEYLNSAQSRP